MWLKFTHVDKALIIYLAQVRLAPVIGRADGYANKGLDVLESRWPYPFQASTEEVVGTLR